MPYIYNTNSILNKCTNFVDILLHYKNCLTFYENLKINQIINKQNVLNIYIKSFCYIHTIHYIAGSRTDTVLAPLESFLSVIDDVPEWFTVEHFRDEIINMLDLESADMLDHLRPQLRYAGYSYKQLIQRLYDGLPMSTGIDFYMAAARHFIGHPVMVIKPQFNLNKEKYGNVQFIFEKEYFCEADKNMNDDEIHLKFVFNGINYYAHSCRQTQPK